MDVTPKSRGKASLSLRKGVSESSPDHSTPKELRLTNSSEQISPIDSPSRYGLLSQDVQVHWGWKSPDGVSFKRNGKEKAMDAMKIGLNTPISNGYVSSKPKRKLNRCNYSEQLRSLAEEFKSFTKGMQSSVCTVKSTEEKLDDGKVSISEAVRDEPIPSPCKPLNSDAVKLNISNHLFEDHTNKAEEEDFGVVHEDCLVVELTPGGLTNQKAFSPGHNFPKVPKLELKTDMNNSDYVILMEDNSIEEEMMRCSQQIEEEYIVRNGNKELGSRMKDSSVKNSPNNMVDCMNLPKKASNPIQSTRNPVIKSNGLSMKRSSPKIRVMDSKCSVVLNENSGSRGSGIGVVGRERRGEEDVMGMLADDSFDNIMLELVVQNDPRNVEQHKDKENVTLPAVRRTGDRSVKLEGDSKPEEPLEMLEDDSLIQPDVLNFLDTVESQAIAASQPSKCTQEEINWKLMEAKKKLAVGKRKRRSRMNGIPSPKPGFVLKEKVSL